MPASGQLGDAAPGGDAASTTHLPNPLTTTQTRLSLIDVQVDDVLLAVGDTRACISVMKSELRCCLKTALTPPTVPLIQVASGRTLPVLGMWSLGVFLTAPQLYYLLCSGIVSLDSSSAIIDCGTGLLQLDLPCFCDAPTTPHPRFLCGLRLPNASSRYVCELYVFSCYFRHRLHLDSSY